MLSVSLVIKTHKIFVGLEPTQIHYGAINFLTIFKVAVCVFYFKQGTLIFYSCKKYVKLLSVPYVAGRDGFEPPHGRFGVRYVAVVVLLKTNINGSAVFSHLTISLYCCTELDSNQRHQAPKALESCRLGLCLSPIITVLCQLSYPCILVGKGETRTHNHGFTIAIINIAVCDFIKPPCLMYVLYH